jgi:hypothetical protein
VTGEHAEDEGETMAAEKNGGFDLGALGGVVGDLFARKHFDIAALEPLWTQVQEHLKGLDTDEIVDKVASWAKALDLPLVRTIPDDVIDKIQKGVKVPLARLVQR